MIGSTAPRSGTTTGTAALDYRIALLTARVGLEPDLAHRYTNDPLSVLTEFGLPAAEPVYLFDERAGQPHGIVWENLDAADASVTYGCFSHFTHSPVAPSEVR